VYLVIGIVGVLIVRYIMTTPKTKLVYFMKTEIELIKANESAESVAGKSGLKKELCIFLKSEGVFPLIYRTFGMLYRLWVAIEGYPYLVNMNRLQDIAKKEVNEEFLALFKNKTLPEIVGKVLRGEFYSRLFDVLIGIPIGIVLGMFLMPLFFQYLGFL
jgi:hypothetical protein